MPDKPNTPSPTAPVAPASPEAATVATPQSDPTPAQIESRSVVKQLDSEIDDLWSKLEGATQPEQQPKLQPEPVVADSGTPVEAKAEPAPKPVEAPKAE